MLNHIAIIWLKDDLSDKQLQEFRAGLETLKKIETVRAVYIGTPAKTAKRPIIDNSYDIGVTILFDSVEDHDKYQVNKIHKKFIENFSSFWTRIVMYDFM